VYIHLLEKASWSLVLSVLDELNCAFTFYRRPGLWSLVLFILEESERVHSLTRVGKLALVLAFLQEVNWAFTFYRRHAGLFGLWYLSF
jgi:hypothetical protein